MLKENFLKVSNTHKLYYATCGNENGTPLLFIHGGPGNFSNKNTILDNIDLNKFYIIFYDQRGCGKSTPNGEIKENTTEDLVNDIKKLLDELKIKQINIIASSWGACLGLLFAIKYPESISKMFLRSTFLATKKDSDWLYNLSSSIFPDLYEKYLKPFLPTNKNINIPKYLFDKIENASFEEKKIIASSISNYEYALMLMTFSNNTFKKAEDLEEIDINSTRIFLHYESNHFFIEDNYIINNSNILNNIYIKFYHGRFDMNCTIDGVYNLHKKLPKSKLVIIPYESHTGSFMKEIQKQDLNDIF